MASDSPQQNAHPETPKTPETPETPESSGTLKAPRTLSGMLSRLSRSRAALVASSSVVVLAVAGTTLGYSALGTDVTLALDGQERQVEVRAETVGDVLAAEGIEVGEHDLVVPGLDDEVVDGSKISVRFGRPLELSVDGEEQTYWVTSTEVADALGEIGQPFSAARLSTSRSAPIGRGGMELEVVTPKTVRVKIADRKVRTRTVTALTVEEALDRLGVRVDKRDRTRPARQHQIEDGDRIVFTDIRVVTRKVRGEAIPAETVERADASLFEGEDEVVRDGRPGSRDVVYRLTFRNGELVVRKVVSQRVLRNPVARVVAVGTKERPAAPAPNYVSGGTVWDALAQCESGGNWSINTGNGYYGGLQFSLSTWRAYGGPGYPHQQSRETQIAIAERLRAATGGYGSWPHCSQQLGLPQ